MPGSILKCYSSTEHVHDTLHPGDGQIITDFDNQYAGKKKQKSNKVKENNIESRVPENGESKGSQG